MHLLDVVAKLSLVADVDGIALAALDIFRNVLSSNARVTRRLNIRNGETVARGLCSVNIHIHIKALCNLLGEDRTHLWQSGKNILNLRSKLLNAIDIRPLYLHSQ